MQRFTTWRGAARVGVTGVLFGLAVLASGAPTAQAQSSEWTTDYGPLVLVLRDGGTVTGRFPTYDGRFEGRLNRQTATIEGFWRQPSSEVRCDTPMGGSYYWGQVIWQVGRGSDLRGVWGYCWRDPSALIQTKDAASIICLDRKCTKFKSLCSDDCIQGRIP